VNSLRQDVALCSPVIRVLKKNLSKTCSYAGQPVGIKIAFHYCMGDLRTIAMQDRVARWLAVALVWVLLAWLPGCGGSSLVDQGFKCSCDMDCRGLLLCVGGTCQGSDSEDCDRLGCADGFVCDAGVCVEASCLSVQCQDHESCVGGSCYPRDCPTRACPGLGEVCVEDDCLPRLCLGVECPPGKRCAAGYCYPVDCETRSCPGYGEVCIDEECTQPSCVGIECPPGQLCANGYCYPAGLCGAVECRPGYVCENDRCVEPSCVLVQCPLGSLCADGLCWQENCLDLDCVPGEVCEEGVCVARPCVNGRCEPCSRNNDCDPERVCVNGVCAPCTRDAQCLSPLTCGGGSQVGVCGCTLKSDAEFCDRLGVLCGPASGEDSCGQLRVVLECGVCGADHFCSAGSCQGYSYSWQTGPWGSCSAACDGGTQSRDVWCQRNDGQLVAEDLCSVDKPGSSRACNEQACCTPSCASHDACGSDGCGGSCGSCGQDRFCYNNHYCVWDHGNKGSETCHTICFWGHSQCVGTSSHSCSTEGVYGIDCYCW